MNDSSPIERDLLDVLAALEAAQQDIRFDDVGRAQAALAPSSSALERARTAAGPAVRGTPLGAVLEHAAAAFELFSKPDPWPQFAASFMASRRELCRALETAYRARAALPVLETFFRLEPAVPVPAATDYPGTGINHVAGEERTAEFALYVPEYYEPTREWPLVVALHGSHGRGEEYLWTWLRAARTRGFLVLAPKSLGATWSITHPDVDERRILAALDRTMQAWHVDPRRVLLTGLSDGATFGYRLGLANAERFSALVPIAGVLPPAVEPLLRSGAGNELPLHVVHGAHDPIFPVASARSATALLHTLGYEVTYTELSDWGHALTGTINERIVVPWFERLPAKAAR